MDYNILKIYDNILLEYSAFQKIKTFCEINNIEVPPHTIWDKELFRGSYTKVIDVIKEELDPGWHIQNPSMSDPAEQRTFLDIVEKIFEDSDIYPPILTKYIFSYHIIENVEDKSKSIEILKELLTQINNAYNYIEENGEDVDRYFDESFNINEDKLTNAAEKRIAQIFELASNSTMSDDQTKVFELLKQYDLL